MPVSTTIVLRPKWNFLDANWALVRTWPERRLLFLVLRRRNCHHNVVCAIHVHFFVKSGQPVNGVFEKSFECLCFFFPAEYTVQVTMAHNQIKHSCCELCCSAVGEWLTRSAFE